MREARVLQVEDTHREVVGRVVEEGEHQGLDEVGRKLHDCLSVGRLDQYLKAIDRSEFRSAFRTYLKTFDRYLGIDSDH